jgi:hypothetical protein
MARTRTPRESSGWNGTAESIGAALGHVAARLDAWKQQRAEIATEIQKVLHSAQGMLGELGGAAGTGASALLRPASSRKGGRPKGYVMSEETKRKLRAAWKRRKAAAKQGSAKA